MPNILHVLNKFMIYNVLGVNYYYGIIIIFQEHIPLLSSVNPMNRVIISAIWESQIQSPAITAIAGLCYVNLFLSY